MKRVKNLLVMSVGLLVLALGMFFAPTVEAADCVLEPETVCHFEDGVGQTLDVCPKDLGNYFNFTCDGFELGLLCVGGTGPYVGGTLVDAKNGEDYIGVCEELCDGVDNNADGGVDEGFANLGDTCSVGTGVCSAEGTYVCAEDGEGTECSAGAGTPSEEVCNDLDDDCDGAVDEGIDLDDDHVSDCEDNCVGKSNPQQNDTDGDGIGNACDNCPDVTNVDQADADQDGEGDVCEVPKVKIVARKIICEDETYLPNRSGGDDIGKNTAEKFMKENKDHCWRGEDWDFQWAYSDTLGWAKDTIYGEAPGWTTFGSTGTKGKTVKKNLAIPEDGKIKVREVLKEGYLTYSNDGDVSAEFYCDQDVQNYDNGDQIKNAQDGDTYYCVAFNVPKPGAIKVTKWECPDEKPTSSRWLDDEGQLWDKREEVDPTEYGCELANGYDFGYEEGEQIVDLCSVTADGTCTSDALAYGKYRVGELNGDGKWEEDMMDIFCAGEREKSNNLTSAFIDAGQTVPCVAFNYKPATIKVQKYLCPEWVNLSDKGFYPDPNKEGNVDGEILAEAGCVVGEGYDFGYEGFMMERGFIMVDPTSNIKSLCTTNEKGTCEGELERGQYQFGETSSDTWNKDIKALYCTDNESDGNPQTLHLHAGDKVTCVAYNPKPLDMCDGHWYGKLDLGEEVVTFDLDKGYKGEWISIYPNGDGGYTFDFHGSVDGKYASANGILTLVNAELDHLDLDFSGGNKLEHHNEAYDTVGGVTGDLSISFNLRVNGDGTYKDQFDFYLDDSQLCDPDPVCGDGTVNQENEVCDDGNSENGDGCDEYCQEETSSTGGGKTSSVGSSPVTPGLLATGPEDGTGSTEDGTGSTEDGTGVIEELITVDESMIPACNEDTYILERLEKLSVQDMVIVQEVPSVFGKKLGQSVLVEVKKFIEKLSTMDDEAKNNIIRKLVCKIEVMKAKRGLRHEHIGIGSGHDYVDYLLQYIQDLAILEFVK